MPASHSDILIVGGGVIGLSTALQLAGRGISVCLVERAHVGREASWAGAGMLPPGIGQTGAASDPATSRERMLRCLSNRIWPELSARLFEQTGIDNEYRNCGGIVLGNGEIDQQIATWQMEGISAERLDSRREIQRFVPGIGENLTQAVWLPEFCQVRNPRHLKALRMACQLSGVRILEGVRELSLKSSRTVVTAATPWRSFHAEKICIAAGAWTGQLLSHLGIHLPVRPIRGQIAQLKPRELPFRCVIEQRRQYMVPRSDGLLLVGSTEEHVGFSKRTTRNGICGLLNFAASIVPQLADSDVVHQWAGLRPGSPDGLPFLGRIPEFDNLFVAAGHFRSGLQMSPGTARVLADQLMDSESPAIKKSFGFH